MKMNDIIPTMTPVWRRSAVSCILLAVTLCSSLGMMALIRAAEPEKVPTHWEPCGWGGGGFYYAAVFHPTRDGTIYLAGDVAGVYKTEDHGRNWRMINQGIASCGVFSLAVDRNNPETVYAATEGGLCKSIDGGENWQILPKTGRKELRITGEKNQSIRSVAVCPSDGNIVYAASPAGKVFKSTDGGQTWKMAYGKTESQGDNNRLRVQFGKVDGQYFGGFWISVKYPADLTTLFQELIR